MNNQIDAMQSAISRLSVRCPISTCFSGSRRNLEVADAKCFAAFEYIKSTGDEEVGWCSRVFGARCQRLVWYGSLECVGEYTMDGWTVEKITLKECVLRMKKNP